MNVMECRYHRLFEVLDLLQAYQLVFETHPMGINDAFYTHSARLYNHIHLVD